AETGGGRRAHGATPVVGRPVVSARPRERFLHWTAAPAVPLVRLSSAATATTRPARSSRVTCTWTRLEPRTLPVCGQLPSGRRWTKGSSAYASAQAARTEAASAPFAALAVVVARIPRGIGARVGVKETLAARPAATERFRSI